MYIVLEFFTDLKDRSHAYNVGDVYPRQGFEVDDKRLQELSTSANRRKRPLIKWVEEPKIEAVETITEAENEPELEAVKRPKKRGKKSAYRDMSGDTELV